MDASGFAVGVTGLTILIFLILHIIGALNYLFNSNSVRVQPNAFEQVLREIGGDGGP